MPVAPIAWFANALLNDDLSAGKIATQSSAFSLSQILSQSWKDRKQDIESPPRNKNRPPLNPNRPG